MSNFVDLSNRIQENFNRITSDPNMHLFTVDLDKDELWNLYLDSFPEGTNNIYRVKREYDCSCCRHFIKSVGNVVYIDDLLNTHSIFEIDTGSEIFQPVMDAIANFVSSCPINGTFYSNDKVVGVPVSHWLNPDTYYSVTFNHFNLKLPDRFVINRNSVKTIPNRIGDDITNQRLFMRTMDDISMEALDTVLELINSNNLFEVATKKKYRFSYKGWISVEELWDMNLEELDGVYKWLISLRKALNGDDSLIKNSKKDVDLENKIEIVKYIFDEKMAEDNAKKAQAEINERKKKITEILAEKQDEALKNASEEDLIKMLKELDD